MSKLKRAAQVLGVGGLVLTGLGLGWYQQHYVVPPEPKIEVKLPSPNGYDTLFEACNLEVGEKDGIVTSPRKTDAIQPLPGRLALLEANKPSIEKLREALAQDYVIPASHLSPDQDFPKWARVREQARMLYFASQTYADSGNLLEAAICALDGIEMGATVPRGGSLISGLVGIACEAIGMKALGDLADKLDAPTARMAAKRLAEIDKKRPPLSSALIVELRYTRQIVRQTFSGGPIAALRGGVIDASDFGDSDEESEKASPSLTDRAKALWLTTVMVYNGPKTSLEAMDRYMKEMVALSERPWSHPRPAPNSPSDPLSQILTPVFTQAEGKWVSVRASNALLRTRLALSAYRQEKGSYPESFEALVTDGYLDAEPSDPFSPTLAPLGYRKDSAEKFTLWSVGPDAKDDGGKPIEMEGKRGFVDFNKPGDFVDGVNTF